MEGVSSEENIIDEIGKWGITLPSDSESDKFDTSMKKSCCKGKSCIISLQLSLIENMITNMEEECIKCNKFKTACIMVTKVEEMASQILSNKEYNRDEGLMSVYMNPEHAPIITTIYRFISNCHLISFLIGYLQL